MKLLSKVGDALLTKFALPALSPEPSDDLVALDAQVETP